MTRVGLGALCLSTLAVVACAQVKIIGEERFETLVDSGILLTYALPKDHQGFSKPPERFATSNQAQSVRFAVFDYPPELFSRIVFSTMFMLSIARNSAEFDEKITKDSYLQTVQGELAKKRTNVIERGVLYPYIPLPAHLTVESVAGTWWVCGDEVTQGSAPNIVTYTCYRPISKSVSVEISVRFAQSAKPQSGEYLQAKGRLLKIAESFRATSVR